MVLLVGQVGSDTTDREAFQEIDYRRMYGDVAKWAAQIDRADRIPEYVAHAWRLAMSGRPGPVVLALPEDVLSGTAVVADAPRAAHTPAAADPAQVAEVRARLAAARSPLVLVGGSRWDPDACADLAEFARRWSLPVACAFRRQDLYDNRLPNYAGDVGIGPIPKLAARVRDADLVVAIGERLGEMTTSGYTLLDAPSPRQALVHVHPGAEEIGRVYQPAVGICATPGAFRAAMLAAGDPDRDVPWRESVASANADYEAWREVRPVPGAVDLWRIVRWLDERLPDDAILANGAGNYTTWLHRLYRHRGIGTQLAPYAGAMGYGVPAAVAAKLLRPASAVISWNGDGCFLMNGQERTYPARVSGTALANPDFAALARAYGAQGETVTTTGGFAPAFERALAHDGPALLHVKLDPQALTMNASLDALREAGLRARA
jgi:acetolactate synthase-1/2/3 large subunit